MLNRRHSLFIVIGLIVVVAAASLAFLYETGFLAPQHPISLIVIAFQLPLFSQTSFSFLYSSSNIACITNVQDTNKNADKFYFPI